MITASIFDTSEALYDAAARLTASAVSAVGAAPAAVLVPGGRTPVPVFSRIAAQRPKPGAGLYLGYTDERMVPETDPQSNYALTLDMIRALDLPESQVLRVDTSVALEQAAARYHQAWEVFFEHGGVIALALLGLGEDGHTCSLFTREQLDNCTSDRYSVPVKREPGPDRVSVTPALLARAARIVFLATGSEKAAVVDAMLQEPSPVVAALAVKHASRVSVWYSPEK